MARATGTRAASAKPAPVKDVKVNGTARRAKTVAPEVVNGTTEEKEPESGPEPEPAAKRKINASQRANARAHKPPAAARGRPKKTAIPVPEPKAAPAPATSKRKKDADTSDDEATPAPEPKKTKVEPPVKAAKRAPAPAPKGPRRVRGEKNEIISIRYTEPLKVFVFGEGANGENGFGATKKAIDIKRPRYNELLTSQEVVRVATGGMHVLALTKNNKILSWGVNDSGALGRDTSAADVKMRDLDADGSDSDSDDETGGLIDLEATPTAIPSEHFPEGTTFVDIAAGDSCSFALTTEGAIYGWGTFRKNEGILGFKGKGDVAKFPQYIEGITKATQIACGTNHVFALTKDGNVYAWGNGQQNQLGRRLTERNLTEGLYPSKVGFRDLSFKRLSHKLVSISSGDYHGFAIAEDGHIWSWGVNNYCETGFPANAGADDANVLTPRIVASLEGKNVEMIAAGSHHNVAITKDGHALVWGRCDGSQTGLPTSTLAAINDEERLLKNNGKPKILIEPMPLPGLKNIVTGSCGPDHTIVIDKDGKAYSWGFSANYQTGQGTDDDIDTPTMIDNTAVRETKLTWAGCGGQYGVLASKK
ncbi:regulator of chromosome condensation 1/beta-lactamase-inhibitor protein II [Ampelomyces quisqualis]|uniref:Regulator of chromosome condensation 1/beta-lactamase-inhibitor protein II n=1 Tax=Ampelomyces quisqualis TaxID=50730 RepID=A0A6A5R065_AMPQU|nr:regulator of chromosome condensation 1/beta-lactamase-inhibitor protein II [Ampelomyces quisqualis]